jgi:hypothetical protein
MKIIQQPLDVTSPVKDVANALNECIARIKTLQTEKQALQAKLDEEDNHRQRLSDVLYQHLRASFKELGAPDFSGEDILRTIEANVKRSVSAVVRDKKKQGRGPQEAKTAARARARIVIDKYHLNDLTESMLKHVDETVATAYAEKIPSRSRH